jgi:hypothetical protein
MIFRVQELLSDLAEKQRDMHRRFRRDVQIPSRPSACTRIRGESEDRDLALKYKRILERERITRGPFFIEDVPGGIVNERLRIAWRPVLPESK